MLQALHADAKVTPLLSWVTPPIVEEPEESLREESLSDVREQVPESKTVSPIHQAFKPKEQLMLRANSLKKALRQIIEEAEKGEPPKFCL